MKRFIADWFRYIFGIKSPSGRINKFEERLCAVECGHEYRPDMGRVWYDGRSDTLEIDLFCSRCGHRKTISGKWDDFWMIGVERINVNRTDENSDSRGVSI